MYYYYIWKYLLQYNVWAVILPISYPHNNGVVKKCCQHLEAIKLQHRLSSLECSPKSGIKCMMLAIFTILEVFAIFACDACVDLSAQMVKHLDQLTHQFSALFIIAVLEYCSNFCSIAVLLYRSIAVLYHCCIASFGSAQAELCSIAVSSLSEPEQQS